MGALHKYKDEDFELFQERKIVTKKEIEEKREIRRLISLYKQYIAYGLLILSIIAIGNAVLLSLKIEIYDIEKQIQRIEKNITIEEAEGVRLRNKLSTLLSDEEIEQYAKDNAMVKAESYRITYIDLSEGDKIVISGGKNIEDDFMFRIEAWFDEKWKSLKAWKSSLF